MEWACEWGRGGGWLLILDCVEGNEGLDMCFSKPGYPDTWCAPTDNAAGEQGLWLCLGWDRLLFSSSLKI